MLFETEKKIVTINKKMTYFGENEVLNKVILFGGSHKGVHTVDEAAHEMGIIACELLTGINNDVKREYVNTLQSCNKNVFNKIIVRYFGFL